MGCARGTAERPTFEYCCIYVLRRVHNGGLSLPPPSPHPIVERSCACTTAASSRRSRASPSSPLARTRSATASSTTSGAAWTFPPIAQRRPATPPCSRPAAGRASTRRASPSTSSRTGRRRCRRRPSTDSRPRGCVWVGGEGRPSTDLRPREGHLYALPSASTPLLSPLLLLPPRLLSPPSSPAAAQAEAPAVRSPPVARQAPHRGREVQGDPQLRGGLHHPVQCACDWGAEIPNYEAGCIIPSNVRAVGGQGTPACPEPVYGVREGGHASKQTWEGGSGSWQREGREAGVQITPSSAIHLPPSVPRRRPHQDRAVPPAAGALPARPARRVARVCGRARGPHRQGAHGRVGGQRRMGGEECGQILLRLFASLLLLPTPTPSSPSHPPSPARVRARRRVGARALLRVRLRHRRSRRSRRGLCTAPRRRLLARQNSDVVASQVQPARGHVTDTHACAAV